jgi:hypothetical protein
MCTLLFRFPAQKALTASKLDLRERLESDSKVGMLEEWLVGTRPTYSEYWRSGAWTERASSVLPQLTASEYCISYPSSSVILCVCTRWSASCCLPSLGWFVATRFVLCRTPTGHSEKVAVLVNHPVALALLHAAINQPEASRSKDPVPHPTCNTRGSFVA